MMKKMKRRQLSLAVAKALGAGAVVGLAAPLAYAQQQPQPAAPDAAVQVAQPTQQQIAAPDAPVKVAQATPAPAAAPAAPVERIQKIEVTGSRIPLQTLESESPVQIITQQDIKYTGLTNIADVISQLPQAFADLGQNLSNGATGTATVNLRGLGAQRTLVLIDGRRLPAGDPRAYPTDLNAIPAPLVQRVDVLTGGASSIYGSDAVAGVVNFIMNDHFEGVQFDYNLNGFNHQQHSFVGSIVAARAVTNPSQFSVPGDVGYDGQTQDISMTMGGNFANGRGNATVYFEYRHSDPVLQSTRDYSACALSATATGFVCGGSSTSFPGRFFDANTGNSFTIANAAGGVRPYVASTDQFNFGPYNYYQVPDVRYLANFFAHYDAFPNVRVYTEFDFMDEKTVLQIAPSGIFFGPIFTLLDSNPLLSQDFKNAFGITPGTPGSVIIGRRNVEGGGRQDIPRHTDYRIVIGAKGDVLDGKWDYDMWWQSGKVVYQDTYLNDFSSPRIQKALNVVKDPNTGQPTCASVLDGTDPSCVPYDIFHSNGVTPAALNYLQTPGFQNGETDQSVIGIHVNSDLGTAYGWKLPWAKTGIGVALGYERRVEKVVLNTDEFFSNFEGAGQGGPVIPLNGQYTVNEGFGEIRVPIMENQPWAQVLSVNGSYRYSSYSTNQTTNTYGLGAEWAPVKAARLRGTYQRAVRAANVIELFTAQGTNLFSFTADPCGPSKTATVAQCQLSGLNPAQYGAAILDNPAGQGNYLQGGNPNLSPEKSDSYTLGIVLQPLPNLSATVDYWNIDVKNNVGVIPPTLALSQCLSTGTFCNLIHRDALGTLWLSGGGFITGTNLNLGSTKTDGIDVTLNYTYPMEKYGSLAFNFTGTWINEFIVEPVPGLGSYDCVGFYGTTCGTPTPEWRHKLQGIWNTPWNWSLSAAWRYIQGVNVDTSSSNPLLAGSPLPPTLHIGTQQYLDIAAQWNINKNFTVRAGVNNVFDHDPPVLDSTIAGPPFGNGNTYPQVYDAMGRNIFLNVTAKF
jgi:outer membrane receptor protein involved in Fe transport